MLEIFLLGRFCVKSEGVGLPETVWKRRKVKNLLKLLALHPNHQLHKEQIIEILWPKLDRAVASSNLYRHLYELRRLLEPDLAQPSASRFITTKMDIVRLESGPDVWIDTQAFEELLEQARLAKSLQSCLEQAVHLYQGDLLLEDLYEEWSFNYRETLKSSFVRALGELAKFYRADHNYDAAIACYKQVLQHNNLSEHTHRELMLTYALTGQRQQALQQYQLCFDTLALELEVEPEPETISLHRKILAQEILARLPLTPVAIEQFDRLWRPTYNAALGATEKQRSQLTTLLTDIYDTKAASKTLEPKAVNEVINVLFQRFDKVIEIFLMAE